MFRSLKDSLVNLIYNRNRYRTVSDAVIVACFYNPENNPYRLLAFHQWYKRIKHLNHRIIECVIGDAEPQLPRSEYITRVKSDSLLWHKEALLNRVIRELPSKYRFVFWLDTDVIFTNPNWMVESVAQMRRDTILGDGVNIVQPFEYCVHLGKDELKPSHLIRDIEARMTNKELRGTKRIWRSFCSNVAADSNVATCTDYDVHGHVGFAWGARREVLEQCPLFDRALIGGADHIMAHAATGHIDHVCVTKAFTNEMDAIREWGKRFAKVVEGRVGYAPGHLYHIWHGDISKREYLKRIQEFSKDSEQVVERDANGLYVAPSKGSNYMKDYYRHREVRQVDDSSSPLVDDFFHVMGYHFLYNQFPSHEPSVESSAPVPYTFDGSDTPIDPDTPIMPELAPDAEGMDTTDYGNYS